MKKQYKISSMIIVLLFISNGFINAQTKSSFFAESFHRGSLLIGISEGNTNSIFTTKSNTADSETPNLVKRSDVHGTRDPLFIEYGITNHWGLGLSSGSDVFSINPSDFYGFKMSDNAPIKVTTNDFTFCTAYHVFSNKRLDLSVFTDIGLFNVQFKGQDGDAAPYQYTSNGNIIRIGSRVRYYFFRHFGAFGMVSSYAGHTSPKDVKDNTVAITYTTNVSGFAVENGTLLSFLQIEQTIIFIWD